MSNLSVLIFAEDLMGVFELYQKAFNATFLLTANGSQGELIHLEMDIMGNKIAVAPPLPRGINKRDNVTVLGLQFDDRETLLKAYHVLKEECLADDGLKVLPWNPLEGYITDKFGVVWCLGLK